MPSRPDFRRTDRSILNHSSDHDSDSWTEWILKLCDGVSGGFQVIVGIGAVLLCSVVVCWALIGLPELVILLTKIIVVIVITCWPTSLVFWIVMPFALALTCFSFWLAAAYENRGNDDVQRGRRVMTADDARRAAHRQFGSADLPPSRMRRRN